MPRPRGEVTIEKPWCCREATSNEAIPVAESHVVLAVGLRALAGAGAPEVIEACVAHSDDDMVLHAYYRAEFATERRQLVLDGYTYVTSAGTSNQ